MTDETKTKFLPVAGLLFIPGLENFYYLLNPHPVRKADSFYTDDMNTFYVVSDSGGVPTHVVVKGPFVIDYRSAGSKILVTVSEAQEEERSAEDINIDNEINDLFLSARLAQTN